MINQKPKNFIIFIFFTLVFTGLFFVLDIFFISKDYNPEEKFIDESLYSEDIVEKIDYIEIAKDIFEDEKSEEDYLKDNIEKRKKLILDHIEDKKDEKIEYFNEENFINIEKINIPKIEFSFVPNYFSKIKNNGKEDIYKVIDSKKISTFIEDLKINFYKERPDVRGRMKNKKVFLYAPHKMKDDELLSIFIHEFSHYIDIYSLKKKNGKDLSNDFYDISWKSSSIIKSGLSGNDFVSGYSMTNKYEDLAESLTYYILHNKDFYYKTGKSLTLKRKYNLFKNKLFLNNEFLNTDFSEDNKVKNYYRDITRIEFSTKNFLQYLKKSI